MTGDGHDKSTARQVGPCAVLALLWIAGILVGVALPWIDTWLTIAFVLAATAGVMLACRRRRAAHGWAALGLVALSAAWGGLHLYRLPDDHLASYLRSEPQLAHLRGVVASEPTLRQAQGGAFADFSYETPRTTCELRITAIESQGRWRPCTGRVLLRIGEADLTLRRGDSIEAHGWLGPFEAPFNAGERDMRQMYARYGIDARLTLPSVGNRRVMQHASPHWPDRFADAAAHSLRLGLEDSSQRVALLDRLLLGRVDADLGDLSDNFRRVGLTHLLSISGAHLMILLMLVWAAARFIGVRPRSAAWGELAILTLFMLIVPANVPIIRAGIMAGLFAFGRATGRRIAAIETLALAMLVVLIWRPGDLFDAGFQLSYGAVAGLILFTRPLGRRLWPGDPLNAHAAGWGRWVADAVAVNLVAFVVVTPIVAYHFRMITPLAPLLSLPALPLVTAILGLGYLKLAIGLLWPTVGQMLAPPLAWLTDLMIVGVRDASTWPGAAWELAKSPSILWVLASLAVVVVALSGLAAQRRKAVTCAAGLCVAWLAVATMPLPNALSLGTPPPVRLHMLAVGDGSCFLLQLHPPNTRPQNIMFDCGSQQFWQTARYSVAPALRSLGVRQIDTLILSHADSDHFNGALDLADAVPIGRVLTQPHVLAEADAQPGSAAAFLVTGLTQRGIPIEIVQQGWRQMIGDISLRMIWPPADLAVQRANDTSLVMRIEAAGKRILLCGDIQQEAIARLLAAPDELRADLCDLPHHGSFIEPSPRFLNAVTPDIVLQSSGPARLRDDPWPAVLAQRNVQRFVTARDGMVTVRLEQNGTMHVETFKQITP